MEQDKFPELFISKSDLQPKLPDPQFGACGSQCQACVRGELEETGLVGVEQFDK